MKFCLTHGRQHYPGETEDVALLGDDLECHESEWPVVDGTVVTAVPTRERADQPYYILADGDLAYLDDRPNAGLVPVKVVSIEPTDLDDHVLWHQANLMVTANRPGFSRGTVVEMSLPNPTLIARQTVLTRRGRISVLGPTRFLTPEGELL